MVSAGASASNAEPVETVTDVSGTDTGSTDLNSGSEESILTGGNDTVADTDSIEVIFDDATDAGTAQETVTTDVSGSAVWKSPVLFRASLNRMCLFHEYSIRFSGTGRLQQY